MALFTVLHGEREEHLFSTDATCGLLQSSLLNLAADTSLYLRPNHQPQHNSGGRETRAGSATSGVSRVTGQESAAPPPANQTTTDIPHYLAVDLLPYSFVKEVASQTKLYPVLLPNSTPNSNTSDSGTKPILSNSTNNKRASSANSNKDSNASNTQAAAANLLLTYMNSVPFVGLSTAAVTQPAQPLLKSGADGSGAAAAKEATSTAAKGASGATGNNNGGISTVSERYVLVGFRAPPKEETNDLFPSKKNATDDRINTLLNKALQGSGSNATNTSYSTVSQAALAEAKEKIQRGRLLHKSGAMSEGSLPALQQAFLTLKQKEEEEINALTGTEGADHSAAAAGGKKKKSVAANGGANGNNALLANLTEEQQLLLRYRGMMPAPESIPVKGTENLVSVTLQEEEEERKRLEEEKLSGSVNPGEEDADHANNAKKGAIKKKASVTGGKGGASGNKNAGQEEGGALTVPLSAAAARLLSSSNNNAHTSPILINLQGCAVSLPKGFTMSNIHTFGADDANQNSDVLQLINTYRHVLQLASHIDVLWHGAGVDPASLSSTTPSSAVTEDAILQSFLNEYFNIIKEKTETLENQIISAVHAANSTGNDKKKKK